MTLMKAQSDDTYSDATNTDAHKARAKKKKVGGSHFRLLDKRKDLLELNEKLKKSQITKIDQEGTYVLYQLPDVQVCMETRTNTATYWLSQDLILTSGMFFPFFFFLDLLSWEFRQINFPVINGIGSNFPENLTGQTKI